MPEVWRTRNPGVELESLFEPADRPAPVGERRRDARAGKLWIEPKPPKELVVDRVRLVGCRRRHPELVAHEPAESNANRESAALDARLDPAGAGTHHKRHLRGRWERRGDGEDGGNGGNAKGRDGENAEETRGTRRGATARTRGVPRRC